MAEEKKNWIPEIMYEESADAASNIPFIQVPTGEEMPKLIYIFESRQMEETEPGPNGEELPVFEWDLHQYADMSALKERMSAIEYDNVRFALGLDPLAKAKIKGHEITQNIKSSVED